MSTIPIEYRARVKQFTESESLELHPRFSQVQQERDELLEACIQTVEENGHLADGENCTLIHLVRVIAKVEGGAA